MKDITLTLDAEAFAAAIVDHPHFASVIESAVQRASNRLPTQSRADEKEFLNISETADFLNLSKATLYEKTSHRQIPFLKSGGKKLLFKRSDLIKWLESGRRKTRTELEAEAEQCLPTKPNRRKS